MSWPEPPRDVVWPPFAYVPGRNARHPEEWFEPIKASVTDDIRPADLHHTWAFKTGLAYLDAGYFWECHEVLESVWMQTNDPSPEREMVQALIQLANARLKVRMGKPRAARRLCDIVRRHLAQCSGHKAILGIGIDEVARRVEMVEVTLI